MPAGRTGASGLVAAVAMAVGLAYTLGSEYVNTEILRSWAYTDAMPRLPGTRIGLTPVLQWLVVPASPSSPSGGGDR